MKKLLIICLLPLLILQSCEKRLDIQPSNVAPEELILSTVDGMDGGLNFVYQTYHNNAGRTFTLWNEALADHLEIRNLSTMPTHLYFYNRDLNAIVSEMVSVTDSRKLSDIKLRELYVPINATSLILEACKRDQASGDYTFAYNKDRLMGECYLMRALCHMQLVNFWAQPWGTTADNSHPGVVINYEPVIDRESQVKPRASLKEVYDFIISDLKEAVRLVPDGYVAGQHSGVFAGRFYKDAARAYLARVYWMQRDYTNAVSTINDIIGATPGNMTRHPLQANLVALFTARGVEGTDEEVLAQTTSVTTVNSSLATWWNASAPESIFSTANPKGLATSQFVADAKYSAADQRLALWFLRQSDGRLAPAKYNRALHFNIPLIRSAEMVLDRAEINAMNNNLEAALEDINLIRGRAQTELLSMPVAQQDLVDSIRTERIRELCFEGDRLPNLRRMQAPVGPGDRAGVTPIAWDSKDLVLKYSEEDMARNPKLVNNY
ncbi:MAG: RagB/SusD family nutrient uptake outer membrane protein [Candidatus Pseudobacter hemicellulosilyticus]|uniref:RagB/SusD family nutrient uptake outer membrane protein n=1 Tax=Candidatus Pseudobacter hemicellulosilyticus TaxID=3121375 RepID=A0AAJ5WQ45_9BACT|nr:MAG: RagB/SusD family nutrient uptake outer membrane protein [Pseudobacter sp.]